MTYRFPAVLCSRVSFRLSVRLVVSRVILRGSTLYCFSHCPIRAYVVDVLAVGVSGHDESVSALGEAHRQLVAHFIGFLRRDLSRLEGLPNLGGDDVVFLAASGGLLILPLGQEELLVDRRRAAPMAADQRAAGGFLRVLGVIGAAFQAGRNALAFVLV